MKCPLCMHRSTNVVECTVCVGKWCTSCHQSIIKRAVEVVLMDADAALQSENCGVSCPFCRHIFNIDSLNRNILDGRLLTTVDAIVQCNKEVHHNTIDETVTWLTSNAFATKLIREMNNELKEFLQNIANIESALCKLHEQHEQLSRETSNLDRESQSTRDIREKINELIMTCEWEWCQVGHLEATIEEQLAEYDAHCNILHLQTAEKPTQHVSDLFRMISPEQGCNVDPIVQKWDDATSPICFFTFLAQRVQFMNNQLDVNGFLRYLQDWFELRNELMQLIDDVHSACRKSTCTGIRRWLRLSDVEDSESATQLSHDFRHLLRVEFQRTRT